MLSMSGSGYGYGVLSQLEGWRVRLGALGEESGNANAAVVGF